MAARIFLLAVSKYMELDQVRYNTNTLLTFFCLASPLFAIAFFASPKVGNLPKTDNLFKKLGMFAMLYIAIVVISVFFFIIVS